MFIGFIETADEKFPDVATRGFVDRATCLYRWQHVAANGDETVV
jgi:hypothetical protein